MDAWDLPETSNANGSKESPYSRIANELSDDAVYELLNYEGMKFKARDQYGNKRVLGAQFPDTYADFVESLAESSKLPFGNKSNLVRAGVHVVVALCQRRDGLPEIPTIQSFLAYEEFERKTKYQEEAIKQIRNLEQTFLDYRSSPEMQIAAEAGLEAFTHNPDSAVREEAKRVLGRKS